MNNRIIIGGIGIFVAGVGTGYGVAKLVGRKKFNAILEEEIESIRDYYDRRNKDGIYSTVQGAGEVLIPDFDPDDAETVARGRAEVDALLADNGYLPLNDAGEIKAVIKTGILPLDDEPFDEGVPVVTAETIIQSIAANSIPIDNPITLVDEDVPEDEVLLPEQMVRNPEKPYIISVDQFMNDTEYDENKVSLLYFEKDDTLVDERESIIKNVEELVGSANLSHFGLGSGDRNVVYIRNEKLKADIELVRDSRSFKSVVLGVKDADDREADAVLRMRVNDE